MVCSQETLICASDSQVSQRRRDLGHPSQVYLQKLTTNRRSQVLSPKSEKQTADDTDVGDVEHRPPLQIDKINDRVVAHDIEQISRGTTEGQSQADLRYASMKPHAGAMERNRGEKCDEPEHYENSTCAGAAVNFVEIGDATDINERDPGDKTPRGEQLHSPLRPLIKQQQGSAGGKQASHKFTQYGRLDLCT